MRSIFLHVIIMLFHFCTNWIFTHWLWESSSPESFLRLSSLRSQAPCSRIRSQSTLKVIQEITSVSIDRTVYLVLGTFDALRIMVRHGEALLPLLWSKNLGRTKLQIKDGIARKRKKKKRSSKFLSNLKIFKSRRSEPVDDSNWVESIIDRFLISRSTTNFVVFAFVRFNFRFVCLFAMIVTCTDYAHHDSATILISSNTQSITNAKLGTSKCGD